MPPTVEPFIVFGYVPFYFGPYFPAIWILRKLQADLAVRNPWSGAPAAQPGLLTLVIGFVFDAFWRSPWCGPSMYISSQGSRSGCVFTGNPTSPAVLGVAFVTFVMIPASSSLPGRHRTDRGGEARRQGRFFPEKAVLGTFLVMFGRRHQPGRTSPPASLVLRR